NLSFGTFDWVGTIADQTDLSLRQPYVKPNRLTERVLSIERYGKAYRAEAARLAGACMTPAHIGPEVAALQEGVGKAEGGAGWAGAGDSARDWACDAGYGWGR